MKILNSRAQHSHLPVLFGRVFIVCGLGIVTVFASWYVALAMSGLILLWRGNPEVVAMGVLLDFLDGAFVSEWSVPVATTILTIVYILQVWIRPYLISSSFRM